MRRMLGDSGHSRIVAGFFGDPAQASKFVPKFCLGPAHVPSSRPHAAHVFHRS